MKEEKVEWEVNLLVFKAWYIYTKFDCYSNDVEHN